MLAMVIYSLKNFQVWKKRYYFFLFYLERKEKELKDKARKDEEDASNGKISCEHYSRK